MNVNRNGKSHTEGITQPKIDKDKLIHLFMLHVDTHTIVLAYLYTHFFTDLTKLLFTLTASNH
jgi:hypothetical protein